VQDGDNNVSKQPTPPTPTAGGDYIHTRKGLVRRDATAEQPAEPAAHEPTESQSPAAARGKPVRTRKSKE
jgi:hypothetical protein